MIHIKIPEELKKELKKQASIKGLSLNAYVRMLLLDIMEQKNEK